MTTTKRHGLQAMFQLNDALHHPLHFLLLVFYLLLESRYLRVFQRDAQGTKVKRINRLVGAVIQLKSDDSVHESFA